MQYQCYSKFIILVYLFISLYIVIVTLARNFGKLLFEVKVKVQI